MFTKGLLRVSILLFVLCASVLHGATLDVDKSGSVDATDGVLILRRLNGASTIDTGVVLPSGQTNASVMQSIDGLGLTLDVDQGGQVDATDGVLILRRLNGASTIDTGVALSAQSSNATVMDTIDRLTTAGNAAVMMTGLLSGATVTASRAVDPATVLFTTTSDSNGKFSPPASLSTGDGEMLLIAATGGKETDGTQTLNNTGTIHALMTTATLKAGNFNLSPLTEMTWQYTRNLVGEVDDDYLGVRLNDLARIFVAQDIDGDGKIDAKDILAFSYLDAAHQAKLKFQSALLSNPNGSGHSVISTLRSSQTDTLRTLLDATFGTVLTLSPMPDARFSKVKVTATTVGKGSVKNATNTIHYDVEKATKDNVSSAFYTKDSAQTQTFTATPTTDTTIRSWDGCDTVSTNNTTCTVSLRNNRNVRVTFDYKNAELSSKWVDLTTADVTVSASGLKVVATAGDSAMIANLAKLATGSLVGGTAGNGFLRRILTVEKVDDLTYNVTTEQASLADVVLKGSGGLKKKLTNADLATVGTTGSTAQAAFVGLPGIELLPAEDYRSQRFRLRFGSGETNSANQARAKGAATQTFNKSVELAPGVTATGTVDLEISVDLDARFGSFGLLSGLEHFHFIPTVTPTGTLALNVGGESSASAGPVLLGTLHFQPFMFAIGGVPVVVKPQLNLYLGAGIEVKETLTASISMAMTAQAGLVYDRNGASTGQWSFIKDLVPQSPSYSLSPLTKSSSISAYLKPEMSATLNGLVNLGIPVTGTLKLNSQQITDVGQLVQDGCVGDLNYTLLWGLNGQFTYDVDMMKALKELLDLANLGNSTAGWLVNGKFVTIPSVSGALEIYNNEWTLAQKTIHDPKCDKKNPPYLQISGKDIVRTIQKGQGGVITETYTLTNTGDESLTWTASFQEGEAITVSATSGTLAAKESQTVTVTLDTSKFPTGTYANGITFRNTAVATDLPWEQTGTSYYQILVYQSDRFVNNGDGTVTDTKTGLILLKNVYCLGGRNWQAALNAAANLANGQCGLKDGSTAGQWRLPKAKYPDRRYDYKTSKWVPPLVQYVWNSQAKTWEPPASGGDEGELGVLLEAYGSVALSGVQASSFWSSTTYAGSADIAWSVNLSYGSVGSYGKSYSYYVWPVRGGQ
ncbi:MAG: DUF1566 domain-containing protein [Magnetococcales bacterium]|nr:DUF1566 domain-containing protein [Magnetococcales bacterium]